MTGDRAACVEKGFSLGADECISKPFGMESVISKMMNLILKK
jgi:DNA-binding response OmpR family regulator